MEFCLRTNDFAIFIYENAYLQTPHPHEHIHVLHEF